MHAGDLAGKHTLIAGEASMTCRTSGGVGDGVSEGAVVQLDGIQVTCGLAAPVLCQVSACYVLGGRVHQRVDLGVRVHALVGCICLRRASTWTLAGARRVMASWLWRP